MLQPQLHEIEFFQCYAFLWYLITDQSHDSVQENIRIILTWALTMFSFNNGDEVFG